MDVATEGCHSAIGETELKPSEPAASMWIVTQKVDLTEHEGNIGSIGFL